MASTTGPGLVPLTVNPSTSRPEGRVIVPAAATRSTLTSGVAGRVAAEVVDGEAGVGRRAAAGGPVTGPVGDPAGRGPPP